MQVQVQLRRNWGLGMEVRMVRKFCLFDRFSHGLYLIMFLVHMIGNTGAGEAAGELGVGDGSMDVSKGKEILSFEQILFFSWMISYRVLFHLKI